MCSKLIAGLVQSTYPHPVVREIDLASARSDLGAIRLTIYDAERPIRLVRTSYVVDMPDSRVSKI